MLGEIHIILKHFSVLFNNFPWLALVHDKNAGSGLWWIVICNSKFGGNKAE